MFLVEVAITILQNNMKLVLTNSAYIYIYIYTYIYISTCIQICTLWLTLCSFLCSIAPDRLTSVFQKYDSVSHIHLTSDCSIINKKYNTEHCTVVNHEVFVYGLQPLHGRNRLLPQQLHRELSQTIIGISDA